MPNSLRSLSLLALLALLSATRVDAQTEVTVLPGEPVRLEVIGGEHGTVGTRCEGRVTSVSQDTLLVVAGGRCARGSYLADLQVIRGEHGSRASHVAFGAFLGGLGGALAGRYTGKATYDKNGNLQRGKMWAGLAIGAAAGGAVGFAFPAGQLWVRAGTPRPLRVIGLNVTPGLEVAINDRR